MVRLSTANIPLYGGSNAEDSDDDCEEQIRAIQIRALREVDRFDMVSATVAQTVSETVSIRVWREAIMHFRVPSLAAR